MVDLPIPEAAAAASLEANFLPGPISRLRLSARVFIALLPICGNMPRFTTHVWVDTTHKWVEDEPMDHVEFLSEVLARLRELKHADLRGVARLSGVPESTLRKIRYGEVKDPRVMTVQALHNYFVTVDAGKVRKQISDASTESTGRRDPVATGV